MTRNEASWDRAARVALAAVLAGVGLGVVGGTGGTVMAVVALVPLLTGLVGWCPLYQVFGVSTCPVPKARTGGEDADRSSGVPA